jgi:hypothetical protein
MLSSSGKTHAMCLLHWGKRKLHLYYILQLVQWLACLSCSIDLAAHYLYPIRCPTSQAVMLQGGIIYSSILSKKYQFLLEYQKNVWSDMARVC